MLLDGQQGFVDAGTPNLRMTDMLAPEHPAYHDGPQLQHRTRSSLYCETEDSFEHDVMSAAEVASMMCFTPPKPGLGVSPPKSGSVGIGVGATAFVHSTGGSGGSPSKSASVSGVSPTKSPKTTPPKAAALRKAVRA